MAKLRLFRDRIAAEAARKIEGMAASLRIGCRSGKSSSRGAYFDWPPESVVMPCVQAQLTEEDVKNLMELAAKRGVDANTILQQAISTEKLIADNVGPKDDLLIKRPDNSYVRVEFKKFGENP